MKKRRRKLMDGDGEIAEELCVSQTEEIGISPKEKLRKAAGRVRELISVHRLLLIRIILPTVYGLLFGGKGFEMGIYPFGISAVCAAMPGAPAAFAAAGTAVSSLFVRGGFCIAAVCAGSAICLALIRKLKRDKDTASFRAVLSMISGAAMAVVFASPDGIRFYEMCGIFLSAVLCPVLSAGLRGLFQSDGRSGISTEAGIYVLFYTCIYSIRTASVTGESVAVVLSMLGTLFAVYAFGIHKGVMAGVAAGLAAEPFYSVIYAAAAAGAGVLMNVSATAAVIAGVLLAMSFGIYGRGASALGDLFVELVFCAAVAIPMFHYKLIPAFLGKGESVSDDLSSRRLDLMQKRLRTLSDSLGAVSTVMRRMSRVFSRPSVMEVRQICDRAFDENCYSCEGRSMCWDREYRATAAAVNGMAVAARSGKTVGVGALPEGMRQRCPYSGAILSRINMDVASSVRVAEKSDSASAMAEDYAAMSRLIDEMTSDGESELEFDGDCTESLAGRLSEMGLRRAEVSVYGKRRRLICIKKLERGCPVSGEELQAAAESVLGCAVSMPEYRINGGQVSLEMHTAERYTAELGRCSLAKRGEQCGDSITSFKGEGGYFYALISDGMGSGGEAAVTSSTCALFLERMLGAGCSLTSALDMLNSFLAGRNTECFTTVDLMEGDLITGKLRFIKSGAAPSFVLRGGKLFRLASKTMPMGIITPFDAEMLTFDAKGGDYVIMLSDGVVHDGEDPEWLYEKLCGEASVLYRGYDLQDAAKELVTAAAEISGYSDDVTVGIVKISEV